MPFFKGKVKIDKVVDSAISGVDKLFFTKEEKLDVSRELADAQVEYLKTTISENSARSVTRRYLAVGIVFVFLALIIAAAVIYGFNIEYAKFVFDLAMSLNTLVVMVAGFFFGAYMVGNHLLKNNNLKKRNKNGKTNN